jgi:hypothetical protein
VFYVRHDAGQVPQVCIGAFATLSEAMDALKPWILCMHAQQQQEEEEEEEQGQHESALSLLPPLAPFGYRPPSVTFPPSWLSFARECICIARSHVSPCLRVLHECQYQRRGHCICIHTLQFKI